MIKVGIIGGTGYTGVELIRLLHLHPQAEIVAVTSRTEAGRTVAEYFPNFAGLSNLEFTEPAATPFQFCDVIFFATPNGTAMKVVPELLSAGKKIIDLAADFRLKDASIWQQWYGEAHACADLLAEAVYGLPEVHRKEIKTAHLIANPGCYPTSVVLGFLPLLEQGLIDSGQLIADAKSGVSGAGRTAKTGSLHAEVSENFKAYGVNGHRHLPEITQVLNSVSKNNIQLTFIPHLVPMNRGIHATLYANISAQNSTDLTQLYRDRFQNEPFVTVLDAGVHPETRAVRGTNRCLLSVNRVSDRQIVILSVIDNLVKGAAGQAVQNMNIMYDLPETTGLEAVGLLP